MTSTKNRLHAAGRKVAAAAGKTTRAAEGKLEAGLRRRRQRRALKRAGKAAVLVGTAALAATAAGLAGKALRKRAATRRDGADFEVALPVDMDQAVARVTDLLRSEGFGILTRIDVHTTLEDKLGVEFRPYVILGACNPALAHRALAADARAGLLLPCNVTVEDVPDGGTRIRIADPAAMLQIGDLKRNADIRQVAEEARERIRRVDQHLQESASRVGA